MIWLIVCALSQTAPNESSHNLVPGWEESLSFKAIHATQAAAADDRYFYAISNTHVAKHDRERGKLLSASTSPGTKHLNSGFIHQRKIYCAHSNYPALPEESDIRVYDPAKETLSVFHLFEKPPGSLVWCIRDPKEDLWWCCFAHYGNDNAKTFLAKMDNRFQELGRWTFPANVISDWDKMSASGGIWDGDSLLVSHHHFKVLYRLKVPQTGSELQWTESLSCPFPGQGIAVDPLTPGGLVGINRYKGTVLFGRKIQK